VAPALLPRPEEVTPGWLSEVLGHPVTGFETEPVGTGQMGDSFRFRLAYESAPANAPETVVGKFTPASEASRATAVTMRTSEVEVRFYQQLAGKVGIRVPHVWFCDVRPETGEYVIVMEDMAGSVPGDQVAGCSVDQASLALDELARLHAPLWGDPALHSYEWLDRSTAENRGMHRALLQMLWDGFRERYADRLEPEVVDLGEVFVSRLEPFLEHQPAAATVQHGDYRLDNLLFGRDEGSPPVCVVDWQTVSLGPGLSDVSYFCGAGLQPEDRRAGERQLVEQYHGRLVSLGVEGYDWDAAWEDYRRYAFSGLLMAVGASMLVERTDRGDDMFMAMAHRHATHALDLDSLELLR